MADDQDVPPGWYATDNNPNREQFWDGTSWRSEQRWRRSTTPAFPFAPSPAREGAAESVRPMPGQPSNPSRAQDAGTLLQASGWVGLIVALAVVSGVVVLIIGVVLISQGHGARGAAVLVVGLLEAAFIGSFATLHQDVRRLRIQVADLSRDITGRFDHS